MSAGTAFGLSLVDPPPPRTRTVGVEEELLLVDAETLRPVPAADGLMRQAAKTVPPGGAVLEWEVKREQIEVVSPPLATLDEIRSSIVTGRRSADAAALAVGARAVALATAPLLCTSHVVASPRYQLMGERFGRTMQEHLTCGLHVHVGVQSPEEGVAVLDRIRPWLPVLLALSANSPFFQGEDSGFASYRYQASGRWPTSGAYDPFGSAEAYRNRVRQMLDAGVLLDPGMIYFDARLSHHVPTVEIRIADVCLHADDAAALAVLVRALVSVSATAAAAGEPFEPEPTTLLRLASWRASRFGLEDDLVDPRTGRLRPAAEVVQALQELADPGFADAEERSAAHAAIASILRRGSGARQQRAVWSAGGDLRDVVALALPSA